MIEKLEKDHGVKFLASFEEEFYILRRKTEYSSERKEEAKKSEEGGEERERERREREKREVERDWEVINRACYSNADGLEVSSGLLTEIVAALDDFGVEVEAFHLEGGPGQYEIVWKYCFFFCFLFFVFCFLFFVFCFLFFVFCFCFCFVLFYLFFLFIYIYIYFLFLLLIVILIPILIFTLFFLRMSSN